MPKERGLIALIFLIVLLVLSVGIVGGAFYLKSQGFSPAQKLADNLPTASSSQTSTLPNLPKQTPLQSTPTPKPLSNKIIFSQLSADGQIQVYLSGLDGSDKQQINQDSNQLLENVFFSGDCSKIFEVVIDKAAYSQSEQQMKKLTDQIASNSATLTAQQTLDYQNELENLVVSIPRSGVLISTADGKVSATVDFQKILQQVGSYRYVQVEGWTSDNQKLRLVLSNTTTAISSADKEAIADYDLESGNTEVLLTQDGGVSSLFYDPAKKYLVYQKSNTLSLSQPDFFAHDFVTNKEASFSALSKTNIYSASSTNGGLSALGQYFGDTSDKSELHLSADYPQDLEVFSIYNPTLPMATIDLGSSSVQRYRNELWWSQPENLLAILSYKNEASGSAGIDYSLNVFSRDGKKVMVQDLGNAATQSIVFSPDEKQLLLDSAEGGNVDDPQNFWEVFDLTSGKITTNKFTKPNLGEPVCWIQS